VYVANPDLLKDTLYDPQREHDACGIGFVVNINGHRSPEIVRQALTILTNLRHRGASGAEPNTGDGAGILMQMPHQFFQQVCAQANIHLPTPGRYGVGVVFLPPDPYQRRAIEAQLSAIINAEGQRVLGWRDVPTDNSTLGETARSRQPVIRQVFIGAATGVASEMAFERHLYVIRRRAEKAIRYGGVPGGDYFYISSLSYKTIVYKGMLTAGQLQDFYPDLTDPAMESGLAMVHSRFSTNTFPSWERAHPFRYVMHNGEINTLRGNINWMKARESIIESELFGGDLARALPVVALDGSDSAIFDNVLELLVLTGRSLPHAIMMMIPEPWSHHESMSPEKRAFYEYHSCIMEPWDGPAAIGFTDGKSIGAVLDRNGLRPARYTVTRDGLLVLSSETGVLNIAPENVLRKGRLQPGRMLLVDTEQGRLIDDDELKHEIASAQPYQQWLDKYMIGLEELPPAGQTNTAAATAVADATAAEASLQQRQRTFGYTYEDLNVILTPMARDGVEPIGSMGTDTPLAVLSSRPQLLYNYFKQLFAQVTNPPVDSNRESLMTSKEMTLGPERNMLRPGPSQCRQVRLSSPMLTNDELARLREINRPGLRAATLPILWDPTSGGAGLAKALDDLCVAANRAIDRDASILILSDRGVDAAHAPIPALLAVAGLHHHLIRKGTRMRVGLVLESGEPREVHHMALLIGFGVGAINPYMVFESLAGMIADGMLPGVTYEQAVATYNKAAGKGIIKIMSKMGICTIDGYRGAQIFEAVGIGRAVIDRYFTDTASRVGGIGLDEIAQEAVMRHAQAFGERLADDPALDPGGQYQWRQDGEQHLLNPLVIHLLQRAARTDDYKVFKQYTALINQPGRDPNTLRNLLDLQPAGEPVPLDEVEPVESIVRRFKTGAMSYGSISPEAHEALAIAMNRLGGKSNTGEGGEDPARYVPLPNGDNRTSAIKQVASGRFGVTSEYLVHAQEIQIKIAQGAKPGEGGQLPGRKVYPWIARVRLSTPGVGLISPPPHHDIYSIEDLAELIYDLKNANPQARISVKLVSEVGVGTIAAGVAKGHADVIVVSGYDGGTGASPQTAIKHAGLPWELAVAETHQTLLANNLRDRIVLETDGQLRTGRDVVTAALLGAEEFGFATGPLITLGCTMMRVCHLDTCPVGIATQNPELRKRFSGDPQYVVNFMRFIAQEVREIMAELGFRTFNELIGRSDCLQPSPRAATHWKAQHLDFGAILARPAVPEGVGRYHQVSQQHGLETSLDRRVLLDLCRPTLDGGQPTRATLPITNADRTVGTILGSEITRRCGGEGLPEDTIWLNFQGSAGQSFGAFIPKGITLALEGDANDYVGKGLSGGKIIVAPPAAATFTAEENIIIGNVAFYGATSGEAYIRGAAGERFCVRNSGANAVVEAVGDHGCEYMTGGRVVVLGPAGRNFAAGMSGGIAYVLDEAGDFATHCNQDMVLLEVLDPEELRWVQGMVRRHVEYTGSVRGRAILDDWQNASQSLVRVMPRDYKRALQAMEQAQVAGLDGEEAIMWAFERNKADAARVTGD
jgi:glutamate synthase (NADPH) large chain